MELEVITGREEARLVCLGALAGVPAEGRSLVMDLGGGSTEVVVAKGPVPLVFWSLPLGDGTRAARGGDRGVRSESDGPARRARRGAVVTAGQFLATTGSSAFRAAMRGLMTSKKAARLATGASREIWIFAGSTKPPFLVRLKCRCGPVDRPVVPT